MFNEIYPKSMPCQGKYFITLVDGQMKPYFSELGSWKMSRSDTNTSS